MSPGSDETLGYASSGQELLKLHDREDPSAAELLALDLAVLDEPEQGCPRDVEHECGLLYIHCQRIDRSLVALGRLGEEKHLLGGENRFLSHSIIQFECVSFNG